MLQKTNKHKTGLRCSLNLFTFIIFCQLPLNHKEFTQKPPNSCCVPCLFMCFTSVLRFAFVNIKYKDFFFCFDVSQADHSPSTLLSAWTLWVKFLPVGPPRWCWCTDVPDQSPACSTSCRWREAGPSQSSTEGTETTETNLSENIWGRCSSCERQRAPLTLDLLPYHWNISDKCSQFDVLCLILNVGVDELVCSWSCRIFIKACPRFHSTVQI